MQGMIGGRSASCAALAALSSLVIGLGTGCRHHNEGSDSLDQRVTTPEQVITITREGTTCKLSDSSNNIDVPVQRGEWVIWRNEYGTDVELTFGTRRLFGVRSAVAYADGAPLRLLVRDDAELDTHKYNTNCGSTLPGPGIIVNPPGS